MLDAPVRALLDGHWYDAVAAMLHAEQIEGRRNDAYHRARELATAAKRVLDLDAEDFATIAKGFSGPWAHRLEESCFPLEPRGPERGALRSLVPLYELMLEVMQLRARRHEPLQVVVTAHLIGEYLCQLGWESTLRHGGDPLLLGRTVGERWGTDDPHCPHSSALRATAKRSLNACNGDLAGYTAYLDKFHSRLGDALAVCAMNHATVGAGDRPDVGETCPNPCSWAVRGSMEARRDLDARIRLALLYVDSPIVALRHHAPVGHFFGVPSVQEISEAWLRTWDRVTQPWCDGSNPLLLGTTPAAFTPDEALPGMSAVVSAVAGRTIGPGRVIRSIGEEIVATLDEIPLGE
jgi:hypothetical protein